MSTSIIPGPNVFRAVSGSLFSSPVNWSRGVVPTGSDVAMIADNCVLDYTNYNIAQLIVKQGQTLSISGSKTLIVSQLLNIDGQISCSGSPTIRITALKSVIKNSSSGTSTFYYSGSVINQTIAGGTYYNLYTEGPQELKRSIASGDLIVSGNLYVGPSYGSYNNSSFDLGRYNLTVLGTASVDSVLVKSGFGYMTFEGPLIMGPGVNNADNGLNFLGNPIVEFKRGVTYSTGYGTAYRGVFNTGGSIWKFSTNNQEIKLRTPLGRNFSADILISGPITASYTDGAVLYIQKSINGDHPSSSFINAGALYLAGSNITPMITGTFDHLTYTGSTMGYVANLSQTLPYNTYANLYIEGIGTKALSGSNTTIRKNLSVSNTGGGEALIYTIFNVSSSNLIVSGSTFIDGKLNKTGPGYMLFMGTYYQNYAINNNRQGTFDFSGNPTVEFQNGFETGNGYGIRDNPINTGTGSWIFSTNNQNFNIWAGGGGVNFQYMSASILISGSITVRYGNTTGQAKGSGIYFLNKIDGTSPASLFINSGSLNFASAIACTGSFLTGSLNTTYIGNTVGFIGDYTATIPTRYSSSLYNLVVQGLGTKTLGTSSYISGSLTIGNNGGSTPGILDLGNYDLILSGSLLMNNPSSPTTFPTILKKSGPGNVTFIGTIIPQNNGYIDFATGSPNVELRNGIQLGATNYFYTGTGSWSFTTNNQSIGIAAANFSTLTFSGPVIVGPGISLTTTAGHTFVISHSLGISGSSPTSRLIHSGSLYFNNINAPTFSNGIFDYTGSTNTIAYVFNESYTLPYNYYYNLIIRGTGSKFLSSNTIISGSIVLGSPGANTAGILELDNYDLFVSGVFDMNNPSPNLTKLSKSGSGTVIFNGLISCQNSAIIDFNIGNPNVELRNGIRLGATQNTIKTGTGSWYFSTNNQDIGQTALYGSTVTFDCPILIGSNINLNVGTAASSNITMRREVNGENASSLFKAGNGNSTIYYNSPQQPMLIGLIDFSSSLNTFVYNSGSQDVKGGIYRNLTFLNGLKTLQGNVSVLNTFSTGSGVTSGSFNLNGFTLTNP